MLEEEEEEEEKGGERKGEGDAQINKKKKGKK